MLIREGLSSKALSPTSICGPVRMLAVVSAENSRSVLSTIASRSGVKLRLAVESSFEGDGVFLSLDLAFLSNCSGFDM